ncbi:MAG: PIN domain-containing protein [Bradyrhizobium sp.]
MADASAILALLKEEPFEKIEPRRLFGATISAVNLSEVLERLCSGGLSQLEAEEAVTSLDLRVVEFDEPQARLAAYLRPHTRRAGLSLGDRACLALGLNLGRPIITADRAWMRVDVGAEIILIR